MIEFDEMNMTLLVTILTVGAAIVTTVLTGTFRLLELWYNNRLARQKKDNKPKLKDVVKNSLEIDKLLYTIMTDFDADRVLFARFHNGGTFIDGVPIDKFTVTNEVFKGDAESISLLLQNVVLSNRAAMIYELLFCGSFLRQDLSQYDNNFEKMSYKNDIKSIYVFLIKDLDDSPIGFIELSYIKNVKKLSTSDINEIKSTHNQILKLSKHKDDSK